MIAFPTQYAGVRFRSRLESKWAAFFDLAGWPWKYEPPIDGEFWIPDFLLTGKTGALKVEVKPIAWARDRDQIIKHATTAPELAKVRHHVRLNAEQVLILGLYPILLDRELNFCTAVLGVLLGHPDIVFLTGGQSLQKLDFVAGDSACVCSAWAVEKLWRGAGDTRAVATDMKLAPRLLSGPTGAAIPIKLAERTLL